MPKIELKSFTIPLSFNATLTLPETASTGSTIAFFESSIGLVVSISNKSAASMAGDVTSKSISPARFAFPSIFTG